MQTLGVAFHDRKIGGRRFDDLDVLGLGGRQHPADDGIDQRREHHRDGLDLELAADDA